MSNFKIDLIASKKAKALVKSRLFPYSLQIAAFGCFLLLIVIGLRTGPTAALSDEVQEIVADTNLTALLVWGLWWPAMVIAAVLFGRVWCTVCPMELLSDLANRLGKATGIGQRA
jgi:polyferredoxin